MYWNLLCLIYYFKIPIINEKWIETLKSHDKKEKESLKDKLDLISEKRKDKKKDKEKHGEEELLKTDIGIDLSDLKENIIPDIIAMLTELFWQVKNYLIKYQQ